MKQEDTFAIGVGPRLGHTHQKRKAGRHRETAPRWRRERSLDHTCYRRKCSRNLHHALRDILNSHLITIRMQTNSPIRRQRSTIGGCTVGARSVGCWQLVTRIEPGRGSTRLNGARFACRQVTAAGSVRVRDLDCIDRRCCRPVGCRLGRLRWPPNEPVEYSAEPLGPLGLVDLRELAFQRGRQCFEVDRAVGVEERGRVDGLGVQLVGVLLLAPLGRCPRTSPRSAPARRASAAGGSGPSACRWSGPWSGPARAARDGSA